jgi:hypothetical protein
MSLRRHLLLRGGAALLLAAGGAAALAAELAFDLKLAHGRVAENMRLIRVTQGDLVRLRFTTDQPVVLHLHGYDIETRVVPGTVAELNFTAYATGRFAIHLHGAGHNHDEAPLAVIEVYPR